MLTAALVAKVGCWCIDKGGAGHDADLHSASHDHSHSNSHSHSGDNRHSHSHGHGHGHGHDVEMSKSMLASKDAHDQDRSFMTNAIAELTGEKLKI